MKKILEESLRIKATENTSQATEYLRKRAIRINKLCKTIFTPEENKAFVGESLL